jgi:Putative adhesin
MGHRSLATLLGEVALPPGTTRVRVEIENGSLEVRVGEAGKVGFRGQVRRATDTAEQLVAFEAQGAELKGELDPAAPTTFVLRGPKRPEGQMIGVLAVEAILTIPDGIEVALAVSGSGNLAIETRAASLDLQCGRGDVRCKHTKGAAKVRTGRGNVILDDHAGDVDVDIGVGDMQVFVREPQKKLLLATGMGNVQCILPPDAQFRADARTQTGKLANGFGLPVVQDGYRASMVGQRGDGRTELAMRSGKGHLSLSHKQFELPR